MASPYVASRDTYALEQRKERLIAPYWAPGSKTRRADYWDNWNPAKMTTALEDYAKADANLASQVSAMKAEMEKQLLTQTVSVPILPVPAYRDDSNATYIGADTYSCVGWPSEKWDKALPRVAAMLKKLVKDSEAQAIVVHGSSGLVMGARLLGYDCGAPFIMLRKDGERSHGSKKQWLSEEPRDPYINRYVWLDDFVSSGSTQSRVERDMSDEGKTRMVGRCLYRGAEKAYNEFFHGRYDSPVHPMFCGAFSG